MIHPVDYSPSQDYGDNPTKSLPADHWIIKQFGNYQPDGHSGIDYPCPSGTPVKAVAAGTVLHVGRLGGTYAGNPWWIAPAFAGFVYVIDHGHFIGIYGHCLDGGARVSKGQRVTEGQVIGLSGNTGASTGDHLHFEALPDGYALDSRMYGRINPASLFGGITTQSATTTPMEDDMPWNEAFDKDVRGSLQNITNEVRGLSDLNVDVRGDLANKGAQLAALTAATNQLATLLAEKQGLDVEAVRAAVASAVADGVTLTVKVGE